MEMKGIVHGHEGYMVGRLHEGQLYLIYDVHILHIMGRFHQISLIQKVYSMFNRLALTLAVFFMLCVIFKISFIN